MESRRIWQTLLGMAILWQVGGPVSATEARSVADFFPPEVRGVNIRQAPLEQEKRDYLKKFGVDDRTLDLFGGIYVDGYVDSVPGGMRWGDIRPDDLGDLEITYDTTGMVKLRPLPPPGIHPRMFFTDADRPFHRNRLENTRGGREALKILMGYTELLKGNYDTNALYAKPDIFKGSMGVHGFLPLFRVGGNNVINRQIWEAYSGGKLPEGLSGNYSELNPGLCALEAFRCWVYEDAEGARKVAKAMETAIRHELAKLKPGQLPGDDTIGVIKRYFNFNLSYIYDFLYNYLTPEQRDLFRGSIIAANFKSNQYGVFQNAKNITSNWTTFSYRMHGWLGVDGDPGYDVLQYLGYKRSMKDYFTYGWFKDGCCFEAFGKNQIGGEIVYPMALRGDFVAAHPHILATLRNYLPHAIVPWGNAYVAYDRWGGIKGLNQNDILPYKNLYPDDKRIDWVYRNCVHPDYSWKEGDGIRVEGYNNSAMFAVIWTVDYDEKNNDPGKIMDSESFVDGQRGLVITRSDWSPDALYLQHHVRGQSGGHVFADRSSFFLGGRGRLWIPNPAIGYETRQNNVVMIDGVPLSNRAAARLANYKRTPMATFSTADLKDTINYEYKRLYDVIGPKGFITLDDAKKGNFIMPEGWEPDPKCFNDYALDKDTRSMAFTTLRFEKADWYSIGKLEAAIRKPRQELQVRDAFRTIGLVRKAEKSKGEPYVLSLDDFATTDGKIHSYDWQARLAADVELIETKTYAVDKNGKPAKPAKPDMPVVTDILLAPHQSITATPNQMKTIEVGSPVLLIRVLQMDGKAPITGPVILGCADDQTQKLVLRTEAAEPQFKILMYPHLYRRSLLPETTWDKKRSRLAIRIGDQVDTYVFSKAKDGRTIFVMNRTVGGKTEVPYQYTDIYEGR